MLELLYFRWWAVLVEPRVVSKQVVVVHRHRYLRHPALQRSLLHRPSCFAKLSKGCSSSEADAMTTNLSQQRTRISLGHTLLCSTGRRNPLMLMLGSTQLSPSLTYWQCHALRLTKPASPRSNFVARHVCGGITTIACFLLIILPLGISLKLLSELII